MILGGIESSFETLLDYLSFHVLLCLIPAFFIAGAMTYFIPKDLIMKYIGKDSDPKIAYSMATAGGFLLAVCSCTVLPLFVGIWKRGAGLGPAITFLFVAPAVNILALTYTGTLIGLDIAIARGILAIVFAVLIGIIMATIFGNDTNSDNNHRDIVQSLVEETKNQPQTNKWTLIPLIIILALSSFLLAILDDYVISILSTTFFNYLPLLNFLLTNSALLQTLIFIVGLITLIIASIKIRSRELTLFLWLIYILMTGTSQITYFNEPLVISGLFIEAAFLNMLGKAVLSGIVTLGLLVFIYKRDFSKLEINLWLNETWIFVKSIIPLILIGVVVAGFIKFFIPTELVANLVGRNTVLANLIGVLFGVFMYFPTLMEVPIARIFLDLGMAKGPLLAYLLADPELSIQSILVTRKFLGDKKNTVYVLLVAVFTTIAGLIFGLILGQGITLW